MLSASFTPAEVAHQTGAIAALTQLRMDLQTQLKAATAHGDDALTLASVVENEAGSSKFNDLERKAIAYAWINEAGGSVQVPKGAQITGFRTLDKKWKDQADYSDQLSFLQQYAKSLGTAVARLDDTDPTKNDPTKGATRWLSPYAMPKQKQHPSDIWRSVSGVASRRAFPDWAPANNSKEMKAGQKSGALGKDYQEMQIVGIPAKDFLFYLGVH